MELAEIVQEILNMFDVSDLLFLFFIILILVLVIIILQIIEKSLRKKLELRKKDRNLYYQRELKKIARLDASPEETLDSLNNLARNFFKEAFGLSQTLEYSELKEEFKKMKKIDCVNFADLMLELNYSGLKVEKSEIHSLIKMFERIIYANKIGEFYQEIQPRKTKSLVLRKLVKGSQKMIKKELALDLREKQETKIEEKETKATAGKWRIKIKEIDALREEINKVLNDITTDKKISEVSNLNISSENYLPELIKKYPEEFDRIREMSARLKEIYKKFSLLYNDLQRYTNSEQEQDIRNIIEDWRKRQERAIESMKNPLKQQIVSSKILEEYLTKLRLIILLKFIR